MKRNNHYFLLDITVKLMTYHHCAVNYMNISQKLFCKGPPLLTHETGLTICHVLQSYDGVEVGVLDPRVIGPGVQLNCNLPHTAAHRRIMLPLRIYK